MKRQDILDKIEEIQNNNDKFIGQNEYDLMCREDIADLFDLQNKELIDKLAELKEKHKYSMINFGIWFAQTYNTEAMFDDELKTRIPEIYEEYTQTHETHKTK